MHKLACTFENGNKKGRKIKKINTVCVYFSSFLELLNNHSLIQPSDID